MHNVTSSHNRHCCGKPTIYVLCVPELHVTISDIKVLSDVQKCCY